MTQEIYDSFCEDLQKRGYKKYPAPSRGDYAWFKGFGESDYEEDRRNYQICFEVYDFRKYADREPYFRTNPYGVEPMVLISRTIDERVDLHLSHTKVEDNNIDEIERLAESFFNWVEKEVEL